MHILPYVKKVGSVSVLDPTCSGSPNMKDNTDNNIHRRYDMKVRSQMQGGKNWIFPKEINAHRFFGDAHWLEIHLCFSVGKAVNETRDR